MKTLFVTLSLVFAFTAKAELKPAGALVPLICGHLNRSVQVCVSKVEQAKEHYFLEIRHFLKDKTYIPVTRKVLNPGIVGVGHFEYSGRLAEVDAENAYGYVVEKEISLRTMQIIVPGSKIQGTLREKLAGEVLEEQQFTLDFMPVTR